MHGISQARILEWIAIFYSRGSSQPRDQTVSLISPALASRSFINCATWGRCRLEVPMTSSSLGAISLLDQLTELIETFYLLDISLLMKTYDTGRARWTRCIEYGERVRDLIDQSPQTLVHQPRSSLNAEWRLHYRGMVDYITSYCIFTHSHLPGGWGWDWNLLTL